MLYCSAHIANFKGILGFSVQSIILVKVETNKTDRNPAITNHKSQTMNFDFPKKANPRLRFKTQQLDLIYTLHVSIHN